MWPYRYWLVSGTPDTTRRFVRCVSLLFLILAPFQAWSQTGPQSPTPQRDRNYRQQRDEWFYRGRVFSGLASGELRKRAYQAKLARRKQRVSLTESNGQISFANGSWTALGTVPLASDASGNGTQDYRQVAGRATAIAIDPADPSGNTVYIGGAQGGIWKATNAANPDPNRVRWSAIADDQATLSI